MDIFASLQSITDSCYDIECLEGYLTERDERSVLLARAVLRCVVGRLQLRDMKSDSLRVRLDAVGLDDDLPF